MTGAETGGQTLKAAADSGPSGALLWRGWRRRHDLLLLLGIEHEALERLRKLIALCEMASSLPDLCEVRSGGRGLLRAVAPLYLLAGDLLGNPLHELAGAAPEDAVARVLACGR